ncbi:hypothetical protein Hanom_Chr08g00705331 [Helianthus anomalus]
MRKRKTNDSFLFLLFILSFFRESIQSTLSYFDFNYNFGESSDNKTTTFIPESSEGSVVPTSYNGRVNDDHAEEVISDFRSHQKKSLLTDLNVLLCLAVITVTGVRVMKTVIVPRMDKIIMAITFLLVMPRTYKKTLVNFLTPKSHWVTTDEQPAYPKFHKKLIRYE